MKKITLILCLLIQLSNYAQKRGLAYGYHSYNDIETLLPELSWWYNWSETPENNILQSFQNYAYEFVPMTWNNNFNENNLRAFLENHPETKYLLAFNEPNFLAQANMTPSQVVALWPTIESIADDYNLEIVSPAVNFCGNCVTENGTNYTSPFDYLDDFFELCEGCRVDHIAIHVYMNTIEATSWYINEFKKYNRPIWVTEFAGWEENGVINSIDDQINYMMSAVDFFESEPDVFRYAWFIGRTNNGINNYPFIDILGDDGTLTKIGDVYKKLPVHNPENVITIPAQIEAENYNSMYGIFLQKNYDLDEFAKVAYIDQGDWLEYKISVPETKTYPISFRVSSTNNSSLSILINNEKKLVQNITNTGSLENWQLFESDILLTKGEHTIKLFAQSNNFNINWFQIGDNSLSIYDISSVNHEYFNIYPNPFESNLHINCPNSEIYEISIRDIIGREILKDVSKNDMVLNLSKLPTGVYLLLITNNNKTTTHKIIKK